MSLYFFELIIYGKGDTFKPTASKHTHEQLKYPVVIFVIRTYPLT